MNVQIVPLSCFHLGTPQTASMTKTPELITSSTSSRCLDSFQSSVIYSACGNGFVYGKLKLLLSVIIIKSGSFGAAPIAGANLMKWGQRVKKKGNVIKTQQITENL